MWRFRSHLIIVVSIAVVVGGGGGNACDESVVGGGVTGGCSVVVRDRTTGNRGGVIPCSGETVGLLCKTVRVSLRIAVFGGLLLVPNRLSLRVQMRYR